MTQPQKFNLIAQMREVTGKKVADLRQQGQLPAVLYGHKIKNLNLALNGAAFEKVLRQAGESSLIDLEIANAKPVKVLIQDVAYNPLSHQIQHVDLYQVRMDEKIKTEIVLNFIGESPAVKDLSAVLVKALDKIEVECLPGDLVSEISVDISVLKNFDDMIRVKDLSIPPNIHVLNNPEATVVLVEEQKIIEEVTVTPEAGPEPIVEGEEKKVVEGEAVPEAAPEKEKTETK